jgi:hypothetical protein
MNGRFTFLFLVTLVIGLFLFQACKKYYFRSNYTDVNTFIHESQNIKTKPFLKAHTKNGDVYIYSDTWDIDTLAGKINGFGKKYDFNRTEVFSGFLSLAIDSVVIFESNKKIEKKNSSKTVGLMILGGLDAVLGLICISNPKACFGSCPTFYLNPHNGFHYADAEGFSNAIAPSLEYGDIDALNNPTINEQHFKLYMKNEALETHCIKDVHLLAFPRAAGQRVYHSANDLFYLCQNNYPVKTATAAEGDITALLQKADKKERYSLADAHNLSSKEEILLTFDGVANKDIGLTIDFRQTLMTTYIIYSAMGYMGNQVSDVFAQLEQNPANRKKLQAGLKKELGNIDVYQWDASQSKWILQSSLNETGPIAINKQFIPLQKNQNKEPIKIKIVLNKGLWRLDCVALTEIVKQVTPVAVPIAAVSNKKQLDTEALQALKDSTQYLYAQPGDEYTLAFDLPTGTDCELFLFSKGYYLEWMRAQWIKDKNLKKLAQMVHQPQLYLKTEARAYKEYEKTMERAFWDSRIDTKTFSFYGD